MHAYIHTYIYVYIICMYIRIEIFEGCSNTSAPAPPCHIHIAYYYFNISSMSISHIISSAPYPYHIMLLYITSPISISYVISLSSAPYPYHLVSSAPYPRGGYQRPRGGSPAYPHGASAGVSIAPPPQGICRNFQRFQT